MDKQQFATLAIGIKSAYPASKILEDNASMDFWYMTLKDIPYEIAENAVMEHICTNIYPPNIAEIRKLCMERCKTPILSFDEAWGVVRKAMSDYGWYHPQEAFATMDELTLAVVKNLGWSRLCQSENPTADRANFREAYEKKAAEAQNTNALPDFVAKNKVLLQKQYVPAIEKKEPVRIEQEKEPEPKPLTEEQREEAKKHLDKLFIFGIGLPSLDQTQQIEYLKKLYNPHEEESITQPPFSTNREKHSFIAIPDRKELTELTDNKLGEYLSEYLKENHIVGLTPRAIRILL